MTITYNWTIAQMDAYPKYEEYNNVVFTVHWRLDGVEGEYSGGVYGSVGLTLNPENTFKPYEELTKDEVISWVKDVLGVEQVTSYETSVSEQINSQITPTSVTMPLPWNSKTYLTSLAI